MVLLFAMAFLHWHQPRVRPIELPAPKPVSGAAVFYNQAFAAMPELNAEEKKLLTAKEPLDVNATKMLLAKYDSSLRLLAKGAAEPACEWGLDLTLGPSMPAPHLSKGFELNNALNLQARMHWLTGDVPAATDDILLMLRFARHMAQPTLLLGNLVMIAMNTVAINSAAQHLQDFDVVSLQKLLDGIATLPPAPSLPQAMAMDSKIFSAWLRHALIGARERQQAEPIVGEDNTLRQLKEGFIPKMTRLSPLVSFYLVRRFEQRSQELNRLMELPYAEGKPKIDAMMKELEGKRRVDILACLALRVGANIRLKDAQSEALWAIFRTALATQLHDPTGLRAQLAKLCDPYDGGPIEIQEVERGVKLVLKSEEGKKPVTLTVGLAKEGGRSATPSPRLLTPPEAAR